MYNLIRIFNIFLIKFFIKIQSKIRSFRTRKQVKGDYTEVHYSYFLQHADQFGIKHTLLKNNVLQLRKGNTVHNVWGGAYLDCDGRASLMIASDRVLCNSMLKEAGIPVPRSVILKSGDYRNALAFKRNINRPIVIKPARGTGDGTGVFIRPESSLSIWFAVTCAGIYGKEFVVEEFFEGTNYRLLFCKGQFLSACARIPCYVVGDGVSTIRELIKKANRGRFKQGHYLKYDPKTRPILYEILISGDLKKCIRKQGFTLNSIPENGNKVQLQNICHWLLGGQYIDVTDIISPKFVEIGKKAVEVIGIKWAGVDLIAADITNPEEGTYVINELNTSPALLVHYEVQNQDKMHPVAREILKIMFT